MVGLTVVGWVIDGGGRLAIVEFWSFGVVVWSFGVLECGMEFWSWSFGSFGVWCGVLESGVFY